MITKIPVSIIVGVARNGVIGAGNTLPWKLPADMRLFKEKTMNKPVVMGRLTYDSIGRPLPGRKNFVITRNADWSADGVTVSHSFPEALAAAILLIKNDPSLDREIMIIGGANIYREALDFSDRVYLTEIDLEVNEGDAFFPTLNDDQWVLDSCIEGDPDSEITYRFKTFSKK